MSAPEIGPAGASLAEKADRLLELALDLRREIDSADPQGTAPTPDLIGQACAELPADGRPVPLMPFFGFGEDLCVGYQADAHVVAEARSVPAGSGQAPALEITILDPGTSQWLTLEMPWRWEPILRKESAHVILRMAANPIATVQPRLRLPVIGGGFRDRSASSLHVGAEPRLLIASAVAERSLLADADLDRAPRMLFFLERKPCTLRFEKLFGW